MKSLVAKTLVAGVLAVTAFAAAPAQAQTGHARHVRAAAHDFISRDVMAMPRSPAVFVGREYVGSDPDANVRLELRRDPGAIDGGGA